MSRPSPSPLSQKSRAIADETLKLQRPHRTTVAAAPNPPTTRRASAFDAPPLRSELAPDDLGGWHELSSAVVKSVIAFLRSQIDRPFPCTRRARLNKRQNFNLASDADLRRPLRGHRRGGPVRECLRSRQVRSADAPTSTRGQVSLLPQPTENTQPQHHTSQLLPAAVLTLRGCTL